MKEYYLLKAEALKYENRITYFREVELCGFSKDASLDVWRIKHLFLDIESIEWSGAIIGSCFLIMENDEYNGVCFHLVNVEPREILEPSKLWEHYKLK